MSSGTALKALRRRSDAMPTRRSTIPVVVSWEKEGTCVSKGIGKVQSLKVG